MAKNELIVVLISTGFADVVMDAAREEGARGGTIVHARGTGDPEKAKKHGIVVTPDKEMVMILVSEDIKEAVMQAVYKRAGLATPGQGIVFSLPVETVVGSKFHKEEIEAKVEEPKEE